MLNLLDGGVNQMITHLGEVTKEDSMVDIKDVFQKMTLDVIARSLIKIIKHNSMNISRCAFGIESNSFTNPATGWHNSWFSIQTVSFIRKCARSAIEPFLAQFWFRWFFKILCHPAWQQDVGIRKKHFWRVHSARLLFHRCLYYPARARSARARRARALRALGLLLADGALTVGWGKTFWGIGRVPSRKRA